MTNPAFSLRRILVDGSFEGSTEIGVIAYPGSFHAEIRGWIEEVIEPGLKAVSVRDRARPRTTAPKRAAEASSGPKQQGRCIRCGSTIPLNPERPYCLEHYRRLGAVQQSGLFGEVLPCLREIGEDINV